MCKWIQIFLASIILLISCTQESGGGSQEGPNDNNQTKTELATLQDIVDNANAGETINLADYTDLTDYNAVINKSLTITNGSLNNAELTVTSENVKLDSLSDLSVKSSSKLTINDSKLNDLLLGTDEVSRSAVVTSSAMAMASVTNCEIGNVKMLGFNSQLNITDKSTKITNIATSTKCKIVLEKGSYIDMKDPEVTGSGELVRIDMTKGMKLDVLSIYQNPNKIEYNVGENFDKSGLIVMGTYFASVEIFKNGWKGEAQESVTKWEDEKDYEISVPDLSTAGVKIVEITSNVNESVKCYFHVFVKSDDSTAAAITVSNVNVMSGKINYKVGEMLDLSGFRVIGKYKDFEINLPYTSDPADGTVLNEFGNKKITFYYSNGDTTGSVTAKISVTTEKEPTESEQPTDETFTITFDANNGSGEMKAQTAKKGEKITLTANTFTKTGYTFSGWATSVDGNGSKYEDKAQITLTENLTLYAQWTEIGKVDQVTFSITGEVDYNTTVTLSCGTDGATIYYATAKGTDIKSITSESLSSGQKYSEPIAITENVTIAAYAVKYGMTNSELTYATFTVKTYTVTFDANGHGTAPKEISGLKKGDKLGDKFPTPPTADGYTFGGWYYGENNEFTAGTKITSDVTLTAKWTPKTGTVYKVEHYQQNIEDDNYTLAKIEPMTGTTDEETAAEAEEATGFNAKEFAQVKIAANGSTVVKIYYDRKMVKLTLNCDNGTEPQTVTEKFGAYVKVDVPTKTGYTFASWNPQLPATFPAENTQYTATWEANTYKITFNSNGGNGTMEEQGFTYDDESKPLLKNVFTKRGETFVGWATSSDGKAVYQNNENFVIGAEDVTLYAKWDSAGFVFVKGATITEAASNSKVFIDGREVKINDFYMCNHEVTQAEYNAVIGSLPSNMATADGDSDNNPVNRISWYGAIVYCNKRSMKEGLTPYYSINDSTNPSDWGEVPTSSNSTWDTATCDFTANGYRLPTEAEWEYAARGGNGLEGTQYTYAGSDTISEVAWYYDGKNMTREVKTKNANDLGLYDMSGNVWEWCWDWYSSISNSIAITGASSGSDRVIRGGAYGEYLGKNTVSYRDYRKEPFSCYSGFGFRVVRTAEN